jgi:hypothetical protein
LNAGAEIEEHKRKGNRTGIQKKKIRKLPNTRKTTETNWKKIK